jgi:regulator of cell morphogenesis and NO signaling
MINKEMTVGQAVLENPNIVQYLSDNNIDFCCGGELHLEDVAKTKEISVEELVNELNAIKKEEVGELEDAVKLDTPKLIDYIIKYHHKRELEMLEDIDAFMRKILMVHYLRHGEELTDYYKRFLTIKANLLPHFYEEEKIEFPNLLAGMKMDTEALVKEHEAVGAILDSLERDTNGFEVPADGCNTYKLTFKKLAEFAEDIHKHIFLENQVLFKRNN